MARPMGQIFCFLLAPSINRTFRTKILGSFCEISCGFRHLDEVNKLKQNCQFGFSHRQLSETRNTQKSSGSVTTPSSWNNWLPETEDVYCQLKAMAEDGWIQVRNTNTDPKHHRFLFPRVTTENGPVIHYAMFVQEEEKKLCGVCQFGEEAQGPVGFYPDGFYLLPTRSLERFAHGGASALMYDAITGVLAYEALKTRIVTASLTVNFKKPTPLRSAILMEANIDKVEGKKIFLKGYLKSPDGTTVYSDCSVLYIDIEEKLRVMGEKGGALES